MASSENAYEVGAVANFMIGRARKDGRPLTHLQLQRLVYIAYGVYMVPRYRKLFAQDIEAWRDGPVVPELYHEFKKFGAAPIRDWSTDFDYEKEKFQVRIVRDDDAAALRVLNMTWIVYGNRSEAGLMTFTHLPSGPWARARVANLRAIPDEWIRGEFVDHFRYLAHQ